MYVHNPGITTIAEASEDNTQAYSNKSQQISCVKQCKINVTPLSRKKQRNLGLRFQAFPLLEFSPALESCSDVYSVPTSCLIVTLLFNLLFLRYFPLFIFQFSLSIVDLIVSVLYTQIERSLLPYCWLAASGNCGQKHFFLLLGTPLIHLAMSF